MLVGCTVSRGSDSATGSSTRPTTSTSSSSKFTPDEDNQDPAEDIEGVVTTRYDGAVHTQPGQRVAYTKAPPDGGRHDPVWADCSGTVYAVPVRNENMVHALEHGAVWIAYNADQVTGGCLLYTSDAADE